MYHVPDGTPGTGEPSASPAKVPVTRSTSSLAIRVTLCNVPGLGAKLLPVRSSVAVPPRVTGPMTLSWSYSPPAVTPLICVWKVAPVKSTPSGLLTFSTAVLRGEKLAPGATVPVPLTAPPMVPLPPRTAPAATLTAPVAAPLLPLTSSVPSLTVVVPV